MSDEARRVGRDEMNLAEFPITLLTDQVPNGVKTLTFEGRHGTLTVTGSDDYGLPTAPDADVIVGLIQLTKQANDFTDPAVKFTRYGLLKLLGWPDRGRYYRRLAESLRRWVGVTLRYDGCWWDNDRKRRVDANFHILDDVTMFDDEDGRSPSSFAWGQRFFQSCRAGNLKMLDLGTYFALRSAVSKQLYRFLDKRFYRGPDWTFDLRELAFEHVGLSRNYTAAKIKEKLKPALEELEGIGFLGPMTAAERYANVGRGRWRIRLVRGTTPVKEGPAAAGQPTGLERELIERGVTPATARELVTQHPEGRIRAQVAAVDWMRGKGRKKIVDDAAFLVDAIRKDYTLPAGLRAEAERAERQRAERAREAEARATKAREREERARVDAYWESLSPEGRAQLEAEALAAADPTTRVNCTTGPAAVRRLGLRAAREEHIRRLLRLPVPS